MLIISIKYFPMAHMALFSNITKIQQPVSESLGKIGQVRLLFYHFVVEKKSTVCHKLFDLHFDNKNIWWFISELNRVHRGR